MAFAATGLLLNHPDWVGDTRSSGKEQTLTLSKDEIAVALRSDAPARALGETVARKASVRGAYKAGEIAGSDAQLRFEGVRGTTDVTIDLETGSTDVAITKTGLLQIINDLHRGKNAGQIWSAVIDISAVLIFLMSALGYVIFLSMRSRVRTALALTGISLACLLGVYIAFVP